MDSKTTIPAQLAELVTGACAKGQRTGGLEILDVLDALTAVPGIRSHHRPVFHYNEYELWAGPLRDIDYLERCLTRVRPLALRVAPEWVTVIPVGADKGVLLLRYPACAGEQLLRVDELEGAFDEQAARRFRHELQTLADHGLVHTYTRGGAHWMVGSETGTIVLDSWHALQSGSPSDRVEMLRSVDHALQWQRDLPTRRAGAAGRGRGLK